MRKAVLGGALLAGALVLSPLGEAAAFADGTPTAVPSVPACPAPTGSDLSVSASTPAEVTTVGGTAYETLSVTSDEDVVPSVEYSVIPPSSSSATPGISWSFDGHGAAGAVFPNGAGGWQMGAVIGQIQPGTHTLVYGFTFTAGMPAGTYSASLQWSGQEYCDGVSSPNSPTITDSLPSLTYAPPSAAGGSGGGSGSGASGGQATDGASAAASASASPSESASPSATASASGDSASDAAAVASAGPTASSSEQTVTLTTSAPTSSDGTTVWMLVAVVLVMLAGSVASGSIVKRRRLALQGAGASGGTSAEPDATSSPTPDATGPASEAGDPDPAPDASPDSEG